MAQRIISNLRKKSETGIKMSKKKSLGHIPLGYSMTGNATFDFIPDRSTAEAPGVEEPVEGLMKEQVHPEVSKKKVVSYYLEEDIINRLRRVADDTNESYSSVASTAIDVYATHLGY
jgi:hypothetical protein